jgi:hypothetical protein
MFSTHLTHAGHTRTFSVQLLPEEGWEVVEKADSRVIRRIQYHDWHRVERALSVFSEQVRDLEAQGWRLIAR